MKHSTLLFFVVTAIFISCRFSKPLICKRDDHIVLTDSNSVTTDSKYFTYLNFHHYISIGGGSVVKFYKDGRLIEKHIFKSGKAGMCDGNNRYFNKEISYDSSGNIDSIRRWIHQNHGVWGVTVMNKLKVK